MAKGSTKYIFVTGGVMSGVGKGIATSSIAKILQARGFRVGALKIDPYLNVDAGTMNPTEHGETFVLATGLETDQDMGNYERFLNIDMVEDSYMTSGMVYKSVIDRERNLGYKGKCVEAIPHVRDEVIRRLKRAAETSKAEILVVEIGGTVGDYQNIMFIEAARVMKLQNPDDVIFAMVTYLPIPSKLGEMKTRPTQHAVQMLNSYGVQTDIVIARAALPLDKKRKEKIAISASIPVERIISAPDVESIYDVPLNFERDHIGLTILDALKLKSKNGSAALIDWETFVKKAKGSTETVRIGIVGKYFDTGDFTLSDSYLSVIEAIKFSAYMSGRKPVIEWLNSGEFEEDAKKLKRLDSYDGIIVPGGFGERGIEGKIRVIQYAREHKIPYFGLCYGMQLAVVEYARHMLGIAGAHTTEIDAQTPEPVIDIMPEQKKNVATSNYGGTMRLGSYPAYLKKGSIARAAYGEEMVLERHRHRYEVNNAYVERLEKGGLVFSGVSPDKRLMEIAELPKSKHPFFLGTQFHPELIARPLRPHPLFTEFVKAAIGRERGRKRARK